jgi:hypothetical protein
LRVVDPFRRSRRAGLYLEVPDGSGDGERFLDCVAPGESDRCEAVDADAVEDLRKDRGAMLKLLGD